MFSFFLLLPVVLLVLAAVGILVLQQTRPSIGYSWLIAALTSLVTVGFLLFLRWQLPLEVVAEFVRPFGEFSEPPIFRLDSSSWPYAFSLAVLSLAFLLTDAARLETEAKPFNWAGGLLVIGLGLITVMAATPATLVVAWTAVDLVELMMVLSTPAGRRMGQQTVTVFAVRVTGTLLVMLAILIARSRGLEFSLGPIPAEIAWYMLLAAGLRLGVLPLNVPYTREVYAWRGLGSVLRMIGPASSLSVLGRMPAQPVFEPAGGILLSFTALAALYGGGMWLATSNELNGRPYWMTALAALAVASVINGQPQASIAWGIVLILVGNVVFLYTAQRKQILFLPLLGVLGIVGLPFTPAAAGWVGLAGTSSVFFLVLFVIAVLFLVWGFIRHVLRPRDELYRMERWVHTVYPAGLIFLIAGQWVVGVLGWQGSLTVGIWWASVITTVLVGLGVILAYLLRARLANDAVSGLWISVFARRVGGAAGAVFRLNWLYRFLAGVYRVVQGMVTLLTGMLEGDGGFLWSLVMLALLVSLVVVGGTQ